MLLESVTILNLPVEEVNVEDLVSIKRNAMMFVVLVRLKTFGASYGKPHANEFHASLHVSVHTFMTQMYILQ